MTELLISRRTLLYAGPAVSMFSPLLLARMASAQNVEAFQSALAESRAEAERLNKEVRGEPGPFSADLAETWRRRDFNGRISVADAAVGLGQGQLRERVLEQNARLADVYLANEIPLIPSPDEITAIVTTPEVQEGDCPNKLEVAWEILLDSLDLLEEKELIKEAIRTLEGVDGYLEDIERSAAESDWDRVVDGLSNLLDFLMDSGIILKLAEKAGEQVARKLLKAVSLRLLPFVGAGYAIVALGFAARRHWDRLTC